MNFVAIDVETAHGKRWSICQIGLVIHFYKLPFFGIVKGFI